MFPLSLREVYRITKMTSINYLFWLPYQHIPLVRYSALSSTYTGEISAAPYPQNQEMVKLGSARAQAGTPRAGWPGPCPRGFWRSPSKKTKMSLGNLCWCSVTLTVQKCFLVFRWNRLCSSLCPLFLVLSLGTMEKSLALALSFWHPHFQFLCTLKRSPSLLFSWLNSLRSLNFLIGELLPSLHHICGPPQDSFQYVDVCLSVEGSELYPALHVQPHQRWVAEKDHLATFWLYFT